MCLRLSDHLSAPQGYHREVRNWEEKGQESAGGREVGCKEERMRQERVKGMGRLLERLGFRESDLRCGTYGQTGDRQTGVSNGNC